MDNPIPGPGQFLRYLYGIRPFIAIVVALFLLSIAAGYLVPSASPGAAKTLISGLQDKAASFSGQSTPMMMLGIFVNNATGALMALLFGLVAGIFPVFFVVSNGLVIGVMLEMVIEKLGVAGGAAVFAAGILPHGIFELPAVLISTAMGLNLGYWALRALLKGDGGVTARLKEGLLIFFFWIVPILLLAAFIEAFVTGAILAYFVHVPVLK